MNKFLRYMFIILAPVFCPAGDLFKNKGCVSHFFNSHRALNTFWTQTLNSQGREGLGCFAAAPCGQAGGKRDRSTEEGGSGSPKTCFRYTPLYFASMSLGCDGSASGSWEIPKKGQFICQTHDQDQNSMTDLDKGQYGIELYRT